MGRVQPPRQQPEQQPQDQQMQERQPQGQEMQAQEGLSFTSQEVEQGIAEQFEGQMLEDLGTVIDAGNDILFGEESHSQIMQGISGEGEELAQQLAQGAIALTDIIVEQSNGTIPGELIAPAATVLMARVAEFLNQSEQANVTDEVFEQAMETYSIVLMDKHDPEFNKKARGGQGMQPGMEPGMEQGMPEQMPQRQGILNQGGA